MARLLEIRLSTQGEIPSDAQRRSVRGIHGRYEIESIESISRRPLRLRLYSTRYARDADFLRPVETTPLVEKILLDTGVVSSPDFKKEYNPPIVFSGAQLFWTLSNLAGVADQPIVEISGQYTRISVSETPEPGEPIARPLEPVNPITTPKFAVPFTIRGSKATVVEQDSSEEIMQTTLAILRTPVGSHIDDPDLGTPDPSFGGASYDEVQEAVKRSEPRAVTVLTSDEIDEQYEQVVSVQIEEPGRGE